MKIHRSRLESGFVQIPNGTVRDPRLSYAARGVLAELLSRGPDDWQATADTQAAAARRQRGQAGEGRRTMRAVYAELTRAGYMQRVTTRGLAGHFSTETHVYDQPQSDVPPGHTESHPSGTSVPPAQTPIPAGRTDVPLTGRPSTGTPVTGTPVSGTSIRRPGTKTEKKTDKENPSLSARARELLAAVDADVSERETDFIITSIKNNGGRIPLAVIRKNIDDGDAPLAIAEARAALAAADQADAEQQKAAAEQQARAAESARRQAERDEAERAELARWREENGWNQDQRPASEPLPIAEPITRAKPKPKPAAKPMTPRDENAERNRQLAALEALMREQAGDPAAAVNGAAPDRPCARCGQPIGEGKQATARYCGTRCKNAATKQRARRRTAEGKRS